MFPVKLEVELNCKKVFEAEYADKELSEITTITLNRAILDRYVGAYKTDNMIFIKITREGEQLVLERSKSLDSPGRRMILMPYEQDKFWAKGNEVRCVFNMEDEPIAPSLSIHWGDTSIAAQRID